jgi:hypothetical protein
MPHFAALVAAPSPTAAVRSKLLAACRDGCTEAMFWVHGFRFGR